MYLSFCCDRYASQVYVVARVAVNARWPGPIRDRRRPLWPGLISRVKSD